jgi:Flp pilus assembly protein TadG
MIRRFFQDKDGAAIVEAALVFPIAIILLAGVVEIGRGLYYYHQFEHLTRGASRLLARLPVAEVTSARATTFITTALAGPGSAPQPARPTITVTLVGEAVRVDAEVTYNFPLLAIIGRDALTMRVRHEEPYIGE